jgi:hypothetical protein
MRKRVCVQVDEISLLKAISFLRGGRRSEDNIK